jgi:ABC-2 type transport system permease protein
MTLWRLELARLIRTRRLHVLIGVYALFGLLGPVSTRYVEDLMRFFEDSLGGARIAFPPPTVVAGLEAYTKNATQVGTIVVVVIAAGALSFDALPEMGVFLRVRVPSVARILFPRFVVTVAAASFAYALGALGAAYESWVLLGPVSWDDLLLGVVAQAFYLAFVVGVVAAVSQFLRGPLATVMASLATLLLLPLLGIAPALGRLLPSHLSSALPRLAGGTAFSELVPALAITAVALGSLWGLAVVGARRRET